MDKRIYSKEFEVHYYEVNRCKEATAMAILNYLEETATCHSDSVGCGIDALVEQGMAWILSRWNVVMDTYPLWNDKITIETWSSGVDRFYATREFVIKDHHGDVIGKASSLWIYLNIERKRPVRVPAELIDLYGTYPSKVMEDPFPDLTAMGSFEYSKDFTVRKCDIDTNQHVNNTRYLEWILESIPEETYDQCQLHSLEVMYKKEIGYGGAIKSKRTTIETTSGIQSFGHAITSSTDDVEHALAKTQWKNR